MLTMLDLMMRLMVCLLDYYLLIRAVVRWAGWVGCEHVCELKMGHFTNALIMINKPLQL